MVSTWWFAENEEGRVYLYRDGMKARSKSGADLGEVVKLKSGKNATVIKVRIYSIYSIYSITYSCFLEMLHVSVSMLK